MCCHSVVANLSVLFSKKKVKSANYFLAIYKWKSPLLIGINKGHKKN